MNETEKRRTELLKNTRKLYDTHYESWPVHQRYLSSASWEDEEKHAEGSSLGIRIFFSLLFFLLCILASRYEEHLYFAITNCIMSK